MKKTLLAAAIALGGFAALNSASAQSYSNGDALLMFRIDQSASAGTTGYNYNVAIDLGNVWGGSALNYNFSSANLASYLDATFGAGWYNNGNLYAGLISANAFSAITSYPMESANSPLLSGNDWSYLNSYAGSSSGVAHAFLAGGTTNSIADSNGGMHWVSVLPINTGVGLVSGFSTYDDPLSTASLGLGNWNGLLPGGISTALSASDSNNPVNLEVNTYYKTGTGTTTNNGTVTIDSTGAISVSTVPEPSTYVLFGVGALVLVLVARRRNA